MALQRIGLVWLILLGCSGRSSLGVGTTAESENGDHDAGQNVGEARDACDDFAETICARVEECSPAWLYEEPQNFGSLDVCVERMAVNCRGNGERRSTLFDQSHVSACTAELATVACDHADLRASWGSWPCLRNLGTVGAGEPCRDDLDCESGQCAAGCICEAGEAPPRSVLLDGDVVHA